MLTCFSKIMEKLLYKRLINFFTKNEVLVKQQYGFQKNISTIHALLNIVTGAYDNISDNLYTGILFLDLAKAFVTVCHQILLAKLDHYGIRGPTNQLLKSYLKRQQFVSLKGVNSCLRRNEFVVPQGTLFLVLYTWSFTFLVIY